jgi:GNAT superfamily N-acetyltransferase
MELVIRPYARADYHGVLKICIAAFEPIHRGFEEVLGRTIFDLQYGDWRAQYAKALRRIPARDRKTKVYVAEVEGEIAGFVFTILDAERKSGEIGLNAVDPTRHGQGIARAMYRFALDDLKRRGAEIACVGTGSDVAHAPARRAYEAVGFDRMIHGLYLFKEL